MALISNEESELGDLASANSEREGLFFAPQLQDDFDSTQICIIAGGCMDQRKKKIVDSINCNWHK